MADISTELANIMSAIYGEEVRGSIHDAIEKMNTQLNSASSSTLNALGFKGDLGTSDGTTYNLNSLTTTSRRGIWRLQANRNYTNAPDDYDQTKTGYLIMYSFGTVDSTASNIKQEIHYFSDSGANANVCWSRVYISGSWTEWKKNVDNTLSTEGAAADAFVVGTRLNNIMDKWALMSFIEPIVSDIDNQIAQGIYYVVTSSVPNWPFDTPGLLLILNAHNQNRATSGPSKDALVQMAFVDGAMSYRIYGTNAWCEWKHDSTDKTLSVENKAADAKAVGDLINGLNVPTVDDTLSTEGAAADAKAVRDLSIISKGALMNSINPLLPADANDCKDSGMYYVTSSFKVNNWAFDSNYEGVLVALNGIPKDTASNSTVQLAFSNGKFAYRIYEGNNSWGGWIENDNGRLLSIIENIADVDSVQNEIEATENQNYYLEKTSAVSCVVKSSTGTELVIYSVPVEAKKNYRVTASNVASIDNAILAFSTQALADNVTCTMLVNNTGGPTIDYSYSPTNDGYLFLCKGTNASMTYKIYEVEDKATIRVDDTLSEEGTPADAKAVGDRLVEVESISEELTEGTKNLLRINSAYDKTGTNKGISYAIAGESVTLNGTSTAEAIMSCYDDVTLQPGTYTISNYEIMPSGCNVQIRKIVDGADAGNVANATTSYRSFTIEEETTVRIRIHWDNNTQISNAAIKLQLEKSQKQTEYSLPITAVDSIARSYNPEVPFDITLESGSRNGVTYDVSNGVVTLNGTPTATTLLVLTRPITLAPGVYIFSNPTKVPALINIQIRQAEYLTGADLGNVIQFKYYGEYIVEQPINVFIRLIINAGSDAFNDVVISPCIARISNAINIQHMGAFPSDINDAITPGIYEAAYTGEYSHDPVGPGNRRMLEVITTKDTPYTTQHMYSLFSSGLNQSQGYKMYSRVLSGSPAAWGDWALIYDSTAFFNIYKNTENYISIETSRKLTLQGLNISIEEGKVILNGTASSNITLRLTSDISLPSGTYTAYNANDVTSSTVWIQIRDWDGGVDHGNLVETKTSGTFTIASNKTVNARLYIGAGTYSNTVIMPQLVSGSVIKPFIPGVTATDYIARRGTVDSVLNEINTNGNLAGDVTLSSTTSHGITFTVTGNTVHITGTSDGTATIQWITASIDLKAGTYLYKNTEPLPTGVIIQLRNYTGGSDSGSIVQTDNSIIFTLSEDTTVRPRILCNTLTNTAGCDVKIQIAKVEEWVEDFDNATTSGIYCKTDSTIRPGNTILEVINASGYIMQKLTVYTANAIASVKTRQFTGNPGSWSDWISEYDCAIDCPDTNVSAYTDKEYNGSTANVGTGISILSYNICNYDWDTNTKGFPSSIYEEKMINLKKMLMGINPDIIGLQEDNTYVDQAHTKTATNYLFRPIWPAIAGSTGTTIRSKMNYISTDALKWSTGRSLIQYATYSVGSKSLLLVSVHPSAGFGDSSITTRATEYEELAAWVNHESTLKRKSDSTNVTCPTWDYCIICGDFNSNSDSDKTNLTSSFSSRDFDFANGGYLGWIYTCTDGTSKTRLSLDNVIVSSNIVINKIKVHENLYPLLYSDHYPVEVNLTLL